MGGVFLHTLVNGICPAEAVSVIRTEANPADDNRWIIQTTVYRRKLTNVSFLLSPD
jgi:hypothetical protein